jgi:hypothetical protein
MMGRRILYAGIIGVLGVIFMPHLKTVVETAMSFASTSSPIVSLIKDNVYLIMIGLWLLIIALVLFWHRGSSNESQ